MHIFRINPDKENVDIFLELGKIESKVCKIDCQKKYCQQYKNDW